MDIDRRHDLLESPRKLPRPPMRTRVALGCAAVLASLTLLAAELSLFDAASRNGASALASVEHRVPASGAIASDRRATRRDEPLTRGAEARRPAEQPAAQDAGLP
jgi:hypothetical protein